MGSSSPWPNGSGGIPQCPVPKNRTLSHSVSYQSRRLFLLENAYPEITAGKSPDALIVISAGKTNEPFAIKLREIYKAWASHHAMSTGEIDISHFWAIRFNGFGGFTLSQPDHGQHERFEVKK
ncbi:MAG: hypothetical protein ACON4R_07620 [Akkermansiaceae bacterium]